MTGKRVSIFLALAAAALLSLAGPALAAVGLAALQGSFAPAGQEAATPAPASPGTPMPPGSLGAVNLDEGPRAAYYDAPKVFTGERISLDFQNADLHNIIRIIGEVSGKNIVVSDRVTGKVTLKLSDVPWDQALDIVLASRNLGVEEAGNVLTIYDLQTLNGIRADRERLAAERRAVALQAPLGKKVFTPKYAPISVVVNELEKLKSDRVGAKIVAIGNDIYVEDEPGAITTMTQIFMRIDRVTRQILIESRIVEVETGFVESLGVTWGVGYVDQSSRGPIGMNPGVPNVFPDEAPIPGSFAGMADFVQGPLGSGSLGFGYLNKAGSLLLNARLNASERANESRTISAPRILAANNQAVSIKQGVLMSFESGSTPTTPANTEWKEAAMELKVKPHIEENGQVITLEIDIKNDSPSGDDIATKQAQTTLMVRDGDTVVIGGIMTDSQISRSNRVPGLHRLPLFGWLFQDHYVSNTKNELLIFITANIIPINI